MNRIGTRDLELEAWQREWRRETEPLPELKRKIKRQNLRSLASVIVMCVCLAVSTAEAWRNRSLLMAGFAIGLWLSSLLLGSYTWWVRRGTWKPAAQTTRAYAELSYRRTVAKVRTIRFSIYFLVATIICFVGVVTRESLLFSETMSHSLGRRLEAAILLAMALELLFFRWWGRRKKRELEETKKSVDAMKE